MTTDQTITIIRYENGTLIEKKYQNEKAARAALRKHGKTVRNFFRYSRVWAELEAELMNYFNLSQSEWVSRTDPTGTLKPGETAELPSGFKLTFRGMATDANELDEIIRSEQIRTSREKKSTRREIKKAKAAVAKASKKRLEAYGVMGSKSTPWRRVFGSEKELNDWTTVHDAVVSGVVDLDEMEAEHRAESKF